MALTAGSRKSDTIFSTSQPFLPKPPKCSHCPLADRVPRQKNSLQLNTVSGLYLWSSSGWPGDSGLEGPWGDLFSPPFCLTQASDLARRKDSIQVTPSAHGPSLKKVQFQLSRKPPRASGSMLEHEARSCGWLGSSPSSLPWPEYKMLSLRFPFSTVLGM